MVFLTYPPPGPYQSVCVPCSAWFLSLHSQQKYREIVFSNFRSQIGLLLIWPQGALGSLNPTWNRIFFFSIFYPVAENEVTHLYCFNSFLVPLVNIFFCLSCCEWLLSLFSGSVTSDSATPRAAACQAPCLHSPRVCWCHTICVWMIGCVM